MKNSIASCITWGNIQQVSGNLVKLRREARLWAIAGTLGRGREHGCVAGGSGLAAIRFCTIQQLKMVFDFNIFKWLGKKKKRRPVFCDTENYLKFKFWFPQMKFYWSATTLTYYRPSHTRSTVRAESLWRRRRNCKTWNTDYLAIYRKKSVTPSLEDYEIASRGLVLAWELTKVRTYLVTQALFVFLKVAIRKNCLPRISHIFCYTAMATKKRNSI